MVIRRSYLLAIAPQWLDLNRRLGVVFLDV